ncbi:MAG: GMC family oxidoreductase [Blastocatellia bacterium]|nr:GMC family oxidoreductase [Blastocatellia bacterium]
MNLAKTKTYDVCIIGSGAAGGFMAKELTAAGAETILLEGGRSIDVEEMNCHAWPYDLPKRGFGFRHQAQMYPDEIEKQIEYRGDRISVSRVRNLGGRTFHWNAACYRFAPDDFREWSVNGIEEDWPLTYEEIAPFYDYVEREMHVFGTKENLPFLPDGNFVAPAPPLRCAERYAQPRLARIGMNLISSRKAVLLKGRGGRGACHYCGHCMDVCDVRAIWSSDITVIPQALATGRLTLRTNALAREILLNPDGLVRGVSFVDRRTRKVEEVRAKLVVVCCATIESARLLLNSKSEKFPNGLANNNDVVGRYLGGHSQTTFMGFLKDLVATDTWQGDGVTDHAYIPRFVKRGRDFVGGYGYQLNYVSRRVAHPARHVEGFGSAYKKRVRELQPGLFQMGGYGKVEHRPSNRVTTDPRKTDNYGIPIPIIQFEFGENDRALFRDLVESAQKIYDACDAELTVNRNVSIGGFASHEVGAVRMGKNPKTSVLNAWNQSHEVRNLFVVDAGCFTTFPEKNPTLTIAALAVRCARHIAAQRKKGAL